MIEVYRNTSEYISMTLYVSGVPTSTGSPVTVTLTDLATKQVVSTGEAEEESIGQYRYLIPLSATEHDTALKATWGFTLNGDQGSRIDIIDVVTPYVTPDEVYAAYPQLREKTFDEIKDMERRVRAVIDAYSGQKFGSKQDTVTVRGTGLDLLRLTQRAYQIDSITVNGHTLTFDSNDIEFYDNYHAFRPFPFGPYYDVKPDVFFYAGRPMFRRDQKYTVTGKFGWEYVPGDINLAAKMLIGDYFCSDSQWRQRGITRVRAADWAFDFGPEAFSGTGNGDVDRILDTYKTLNMVVI